MSADFPQSAREGRARVDRAREDGAVAAPLAGVQRELIGAHLLLLSRLLRKSARVDYARFEPQNQMERRILLTLVRIEEGRVSNLASLLGSDVAQVSRALSALRRATLVGRDRQRDPYRLTPAGLAIGSRLDEVALRREDEFAHGFNPLQLFEFAGLIANLQQKAAAILAEETVSADANNPGDASRGAPPSGLEIHSRVQPAILNLANTIARSATLAFKRLAGLSHYEWRVLANIVSRPHISFMELVTHIDSDKAQVSRALDPMVRSGLLSRTGGGGGEAVRFDLTDEGRERHAIMEADALRRNALLLDGLGDGQRHRLRSYLALLIANATDMARRAD